MFKFPWTNFHELNLDWILHEIKVVKEKVEELFEKLKELADRVTGAEADIEGVDTRVTYLEDHPYVLPQADGERLGGIKARVRDTEEENLEVKIDPVTGILYTKGDFSEYVEVNGQTANTEGYFAYVGTENLFQISPESFSVGMSDDASAHIDFSMYVDVNDAPHLRINSFDDVYLNPFNGEQNSKLRYITSGDETALDEIANKQYVLSHGGGGYLYQHMIEFNFQTGGHTAHIVATFVSSSAERVTDIFNTGITAVTFSDGTVEIPAYGRYDGFPGDTNDHDIASLRIKNDRLVIRSNENLSEDITKATLEALEVEYTDIVSRLF